MKLSNIAVGVAAITLSASIQAEEVEVLHWWTSGGEAAALNVLKDDLKSEGIGWADMPVAGGGGESATTVLRARVTSGNAPAAAQMLGFDIQDWGETGLAANLNSVAAENNWDAVVPPALQEFSKYNGNWIAAPVNVHSTNWVWANKAIFDELNLDTPTNFDELVEVLEAIEQAGYVALAHGGQAWQDATIFDSVVLSVGGVDFYRDALVDLNEDALRSDQMKMAFDRMAILRGYVDDNFSGRDWNLASAMVINKEAGIQIMGDWAKGEFLSAGLEPQEDFMCFRFPGTEGSVSFNSDQFVMFKVGDEKEAAQDQLAASIMKPDFQVAFNVVKGSVPARTDVSDAEFDACGKKGMKDLAEASSSNTLVGSMAHGHASPASVKNAMLDVITAHFNGVYDSEEAVEEMALAVELAM